jgi:hypothetical protein
MAYIEQAGHCTGWRDLDATEAKRRRLQAFQPLPKPPAKPRVVRLTPSLPRMPWGSRYLKRRAENG